MASSRLRAALFRSTIATAAAVALTVSGLAADPAGAAPNKGTPGAPTGVTASAGNATALLRWTPPANTGTSAITGYQITASPGGATVQTTNVTAYTVGNLTNGTAYTFTVAARNSGGLGAASVASAPVTPLAPTAPDAPQAVTAVAGYQAATITWSPPANDGRSPISGYTITPSGGGTPVTAGGSDRSVTVRGLTNGTSYSFSVTATNAIGTGAAASTASVTPDVTVPEAPASVSAAATGGAVTVSWSAPISDGGSPLTGYTVTADPGGATVSTDTATTSTSVTGLTSGTAYTFTVVATNDLGPGAAATTQPTLPDVTVASTTVALTDADLASLSDVSNDGTLVFTNPPSDVTGLTSGDVLVAGVSAQTPMGLLRQVTGVSTVGSEETVTTAAAALDQAISDGGVSLDGTLTRQQVQQFTPKRAGVRLAPAALGGDPSMSVSIDSDLYKDDSGRSVHVSGELTFTPHIEFSASLHCCFHLDTHFVASLEAESKLSLTAEMKVEFEHSFPLATLRFPPIEFSVGPVPVVVVPELELSLEANGSVSVGITTSVTHTDKVGVQLDTHDGDVNAQPINEHSTSFDPPTIFSGAEFKAGPRSRLVLYLYGVAGPYVQNTLYLLDVSANTSEDPWWKLQVEDTIGAGFKVSVMGHQLADWSADPLLTFDIPLIDAGGPYQGVDISPDPASVAPGGKLSLSAVVERSSNQSVTWSVESGGGKISRQGVYTAPTTPGTYTVTATSPASLLKPETKGEIGVVVGAQPPGQPSGVTASSSRYGTADVSWTPPTYTGGSAVTGYEIATDPVTTTTSAGAATTATVSGLSARTYYRFAVRAINAAGTGQWSAYSDPVLISDVITGGKGVLVIGTGDYGSTSGSDWLASELNGAGYTVVTSYSDVVPADLSSFGQIWDVSTNPISTSDADRLVAFAKNGGGLYITGERPCCESENASASYIISQLVPGSSVQVGGLGDPYYATGPLPVNPSAVGGSTARPFALSTWTVSAPGGMAGVPDANVFASVSGPGSTPVAAVWGRSQVSGGGRLAVLMDINWLEPGVMDTTTAPQIAQDLALFLSGLSVPPAAPVAAPARIAATRVTTTTVSHTAAPSTTKKHVTTKHHPTKRTPKR